MKDPFKLGMVVGLGGLIGFSIWLAVLKPNIVKPTVSTPTRLTDAADWVVIRTWNTNGRPMEIWFHKRKEQK